MGATNVTRQAELEQFYAYALPGFLDYLARHSAQMSDMEVVSSLDGITSMPAYQRLEGVEKTVLAPLNLLTKDVDEQVSAAMEATRNAQLATAAALNAVEESNTATDECKTATQTAIAATTDAQEATGLATTAANKADAARVRLENIEAEANSLIEQQQSALTETQSATAAAKTATTETLTATANAKTATTNANAAAEAANAATQAATEAKTACETATANAQAATAEALEAIANENARIEAEAARVQAEAARAQAEAQRVLQWTAWFEDGTNGVKALYNTWFNSTAAAWDGFNSTASAQETARQSAEEGRQSAEADRVAAELERAAAENLRKSAETGRQEAETSRETEFERIMSDCDDATKLATAAAALAVSEAKKATDAAADASAATAAAIEATSKANRATSDANTATSNANMATSNANAAASRVDDAITSAEQATLAAISATDAANAAADSVETAKTEALTAASNATTAAASATAAADSANSAAAAAIEAAERANAAAAAKQIDWINVVNKPTTLSGYGITDASIDGGTIYIGGQSITPLTEHQSLANYPTKADVDAALTLKAAKTEVDAALAQKADTATMEAALALKATKTEVDAALALKADTSSVNSALALKSDKTEVDAALALKANKSDVYTKTESDNKYLSLSGKAVDAQHADDATHAGTADNSAKVNGLEVKTSVPENAKFTDTIYTVPTLGAVPTEDTLTWTDADNKQQDFQVGYMCRVADETSETGYTFYQLNAIEEGKAVWSKVWTGSEGSNSDILISTIYIDQTITDPASMISGDINGVAIQAIRANSHRYLGKYTASSGVMTICQLSDTDSTKFADGSSADLTGAQGDVFMRLPVFYTHALEIAEDLWQIKFAFGGRPEGDRWMQWGSNDLIGVYKAYHSSGKIYSRSGVTPSSRISQANFKTYARNRGTGFTLVKHKHQNIMAFLFYAFYGNTNAQAICGSGTSSYPKTAGATNSLGMTDTTTTNGNSMSINFWGLENWWGDLNEFEDNVIVNSNTWNITEDDGTTRQVTGFAANNIWYYPKKLVIGDNLDTIMKPGSSSGSETIGYCDGQYLSPADSRIVLRSFFGSEALSGLVFVIVNDDSSRVDQNRGSRLAFCGNIIEEDNPETFKSLTAIG